MAERLDVVRGAGPPGHPPRRTPASWSRRRAPSAASSTSSSRRSAASSTPSRSKAQDAGVAGAGHRRQGRAGADARAGPERRVSIRRSRPNGRIRAMLDAKVARIAASCWSSRPRRARARPRWRTGWPSRSAWSSRSRTRRARRAPASRTASTTSSSPRTSSRAWSSATSSPSGRSSTAAATAPPSTPSTARSRTARTTCSTSTTRAAPRSGGSGRDESVLVFILPPSMAELERRLRRRATDAPEAIDAPAGDGDARARALRRVRLPGGERQPRDGAQGAVAASTWRRAARAPAASTTDTRCWPKRRSRDGGAAVLVAMSDVQEIVASGQAYDGAADTGSHRTQLRLRGRAPRRPEAPLGRPYVVHPVGVARIIAELRLDVPSVCAGLLHDCVEDTSATAEEHRPSCSARRSRSSSTASPSSARSPWTRRARSSRRRTSARCCSRWRATSASSWSSSATASTTCGRSITCRPRSRSASPRETLEIYAPLANRLGIQWIKGELEDLAFRYLEPERVRAARRARSRRPRRARATYIDRGREAASRSELAESGVAVRGHRPRQAPVVDLPEDEADAARRSSRSTTSSRFRVITESRDATATQALGVVHSHVDAGPGPLQGLHRAAQAEHVPVAAHDGDRPARRAHRGPDPHRRRCTASPSRASPRTGSTRRASRRRRRATTRSSPGCAS